LLPRSESDNIGRSVQRGVEDIEAERLAEYDAKGLLGLTKKLVAKLARKKHRATRVDDAAP